MGMKFSGISVSNPLRLLFMMCLSFAAALCTMLLIPAGTVKATDCTAVVGKTPDQAPGIDCPQANRPCPPNDCMCYQGSELIGIPGVTYANGSSKQGGGCGTNASTTYNAASHCGPISACVLLGSDPPISNKQWDEPLQGFPSLGNFMSGKCQPYGTSGTVVGSGSGLISCPVTANPVGR